MLNAIDEGFAICELVRDAGNNAFDYRYLEINPALEKMYGLTREELLGRLGSGLRPDTYQERVRTFEAVIRDLAPRRFEEHDLNAGRWFQIKAAPLDSDRIVMLCDEITETKKFEEARVMAELTHRDAGTALLLELTKDFMQVSTEEQLMQVVGAKLGAHLSIDSYGLLDIDDGLGVATNLSNWSAGDVPDLRGTYRIADYVTDDFVRAMRTGEIGIINDAQNDPRTVAQALASSEIRACIVIPYLRDGAWTGCFLVTDRRPREWRQEEVDLIQEVATRTLPRIARIRAEQQFLQTNQRLNDILSSIQDDFYVLNPNWEFVFVSRTFSLRVDKEPEDFLGKNIWELFPKHVGGELYENFHLAMEKREIRRFEIPGRYTDAWYSVTAFPSKEGISVHGVDISERRRMEEERTRAEHRYRLVGDLIPFGVWETDREGNATYLSPLFLELTGHTLEEHRQSWQSLIHAEETDSLVHAWRECVRTGATWDREFRIRGSDGKFHAIHARGLPLYDAEGEVTSYVGINFDVTEHRQVKDALRESEKQLQLLNESLEKKVEEKSAEVRSLATDLTKAVHRERHRLARILHDDLQQRIHAVRMQMSLLGNELPTENEKARNEALDIEKQLGEVLEITRDLSIDLSPPILREEGLAHAIGWLAEFMSRRHGLSIEIQADEPFFIPDEELHVFLFSCVRELLFNTVKHAQAADAAVALEWVDGDLRIEVRDDGTGFEPENAQVEVVEEVKSPGSGIATMRRQLGLFGGRMEIQSGPGFGTKIILSVPVAR
jgi:PAS domain S-box-containing protein